MLKIAAPLVLVAFILFIWASARPVPIQVRVTFTGFITNTANLALVQASFCVSNAGRCSVFKEGNGIYRTEIKNQPQVVFYAVAMFGELKPGEFKTISQTPPPEISRASVARWKQTVWLSPPTESQREAVARLDDAAGVRLGPNLQPWRISLSFSKPDWREKLVRNPPSALRKILRFVPAKWLERHPVEAHSDWVEGRELM